MKTKLIVCGVVLGLAVVGSWVSVAEEPFLLLKDLRPGMEGIGKTVVKGDTIESFPIKIVGVVDNPGDLNDFILIRAGGEAIKASGGIAAGMSGSPVYVDGKLVGAIAAAAIFDVSESPIAVVTPIASMLQLVKPVRKKANERLTTVGSKSNSKGLDLQTCKLANLHTVHCVPVLTPVMVSGLSERAFEVLKRGMNVQSLGQSDTRWLSVGNASDFLKELEVGLEERFNLMLYRSGSVSTASAAEQADSKAKLEPGSAIGALLTAGDVTIGAIGTLTYKEDDVILAFGHPFLFGGDAEFFLTDAKILDTVESLMIPFKLGVPGKALGAFLEDRTQGIGGALNVEPDSVEVELRVRNLDTDTSREFKMDIADDHRLLASLLFISGLSAIDETLNRIGPGTLKIDYTIRGDGLPEKLERRDIFTSLTDIAVWGPLQVAQVAFTLLRNEFKDPELDEIDIDIDVKEEVRLLRVKEITADKEMYKPGEPINYTVTLKPYRGEEFSIEGALRVPDEIESNQLTLHAFGGPRRDRGDEKEAPEFKDLKELIETIASGPSNDQLTIELVEFAGAPSEEGIDPQEVRHVQTLDAWVVTGEKSIEIRIEKPQPPEEKKEGEKEKEEGEKEEGKKEEEKQEENKKGCKYQFYCPSRLQE